MNSNFLTPVTENALSHVNYDEMQLSTDASNTQLQEYHQSDKFLNIKQLLIHANHNVPDSFDSLLYDQEIFEFLKCFSNHIKSRTELAKLKIKTLINAQIEFENESNHQNKLLIII